MTLVFSNDFAEVWKNETVGQSSFYIRKDFKAGEEICDFGASAILPTPSYLTIQKDVDEHICLHPVFLQYINHSCSPNVFFDISTGKLVCLQDVKAGTEITYFYPSTEWDMAAPFQCQCGSSNCLEYIRGAKHIPREVIAGYRVSDFIKGQLLANRS